MRVFGIQSVGTVDHCRIVITPPGEKEIVLGPQKLDRRLLEELQQIQSHLSLSASDRTRGVASAAPTVTPQVLRRVGERLFEVAFPGDSYERLSKSQRETTGGEGLLIKFVNSVSDLSFVPWELIYNPSSHQFISLTPGVSFSRGTTEENIETSRQLPINILVVSARPKSLSGNAVPDIDADAEVDTLQQALGEQETEGTVTLNYADGPSYDEIYDRLHSKIAGGWHVFHFIGHGGFSADDGYVVLQAKGSNRGTLVTADELVSLLNVKPALQLVVLNSCSGAESERGEIFSSTALKLISADIPAVVAMQTAISDQAAIDFAQRFYKYLAVGKSIQDAITDTRITMKPTYPLECFSPVLYLRSNGQLFTVKDGAVYG